MLISAGGTREAIDPVRVLTNRSSGRQGYALAEVAPRDGRATSRSSRPSSANSASTRVRAIDVVRVESAHELHDAMLERAPESDCVIMAAAVADFTLKPARTRSSSGTTDRPTLHFEPPRRA